MAKADLFGGPLDGCTVETTGEEFYPEMIHFSNERRVHRYLWENGGVFKCLSPDLILENDNAAFEKWWSEESRDQRGKQIARAAWHAALSTHF
jgi:hypothetical protein